MTLPVSVRVNVLPFFPARAQGAGFIKVTKANGVYTITADYSVLTALGSIPDATKKTIVVQDTQTGVQNSITVAILAAAVASIVTTSGLAGAILNTYRIVTAAGTVTIATTDAIILLNKTVGEPTNIALPASSVRLGVPVTVKDLKGDANTNNITFVPAAGETIDGFSAAAAAANGAALIDVNYGKKTLYPLTSGGWYI